MLARAAARHFQGSTRSLGFRAAASCSTATALRPALELCGASDAYALGKLKFPEVIQLPLQLNHGFAAKTEVVDDTEKLADTSVIHPKGGPDQGVKRKPSADESSAARGSVSPDDVKRDAKGRANHTYWLMQPVYRKEYVQKIYPKHLKPETLRQKLALLVINTTRFVFDKATGYGPHMTKDKWLRRIIFLETVAGVPGMVGGMLRHMKSLRSMERDNAWIHTLLEEAENERMHLLTFMQLRQPGPIFRTAVLGAQGIFFNFLFLAYVIHPRWVHSFVGYLEEEAVKTYTHCIEDLDAGRIPEWSDMKAPEIAKKYWALADGEDSMRDLLLAVRADEAGHSHVNHTLSQLEANEPNPFAPGSHEVP